VNVIPVEFTAEHLEEQKFNPNCRDFLRSKEPYASMLRNNPWLMPPDPSKPLDWGSGHYYDTTTGDQHPYWKDQPLPKPTKDLSSLYRDLEQWGFCLIEDALSATQLKAIRSRVDEQAKAEQLAGLADNSPALQIVWALINKGQCFVDCLELDPAGVQAGPLIERLLNDFMRPGWCYYSFLSNIAHQGCYPQGLHQDQSAVSPWQTPEAPLLLNVVYLLDDVSDANGGTLIIPGSHRQVSEQGRVGEIGELPPAINLKAPAGTVLIMDGRVMHGTGVNKSSESRYILTNSVVKSWIKPQKNWLMNVRPEVLDGLSDKLLQRIGFQARVNEHITDGFGSHGTGRAGDRRSDIKQYRQAYDTQTFQRIGELSEDFVRNHPDFTWTSQIAWQNSRSR
jgi:hypothetical protein